MGYKYSRQDCIEALQQADRELEGLITGPKYREWCVGKDRVPSYGIVTNRFTFNELKEDANLATLDCGVGEGEGASIRFKKQGRTYYTRVKVQDGDEQKSFYEHRLVAIALYGYDEVVEKDVHHKNGHAFDNRHSNIKLLTKEEHNRLHAQDQERTEGGEFA